jgi:glycosyltransferase involved in cell wall biosynthesis
MLLRGDYEVASIHDPEMLPAGLVAALLRRTVVFDVHENVPGQLRTKDWLLPVLRRPLSWVAARLLRFAERLLAITLAEAGYQKLFVKEHPVFPNYLFGVPPTPQEPDPDVGVVYLGDVTEARGLALAVEAVAAAGAPKMTVMGRCKPEFRSQLLTTANRQGLDLVFRGFVSPDEALRISAGGSVGLSPLLDAPNYRASLPTKVLEYLAVGIPTVASDLPGTRQVVGDKPGVTLVPPGDIDAWQDAIACVLADPEQRAAARTGAAAIRAAYVWPEAAVRDFYRALL